MNLTVNGAAHQAAESTTVAGLLGELQLAASAGVAIAVNQQVIPRSQWPHALLRESDQVLIIQPTQGG